MCHKLNSEQNMEWVGHPKAWHCYKEEIFFKSLRVGFYCGAFKEGELSVKYGIPFNMR